MDCVDGDKRGRKGGAQKRRRRQGHLPGRASGVGWAMWLGLRTVGTVLNETM